MRQLFLCKSVMCGLAMCASIYHTDKFTAITETIIETIYTNISFQPDIVEADWSEYFDGINGCAVLYDADDMQYTIYQEELALTESSPCSTFKIISSLIALENGIIQPDNSLRIWSGEVFWNEKWNQDIDFTGAFRESCVWYFREVIDEMGPELIQEELNRLQYGNCDISDWEGRLNTNNNNRALTGFWVESSLKISPKAQGIVVNAWFTGFAEGKQGKVYFCVHLDQTEDRNVSSAKAKEIAVQIVSDYCAR